MHVVVEEFAQGLVGVTDVSDKCNRIDELGRSGNWSALNELYRALRTPPAGIPEWALRSVRERIIDVVAQTPGFENALVARCLIQLDPPTPRDLRRAFLAAKLAKAHSAETLTALISSTDLEFSGCLLQEAIFAGKRLSPGAEIEATKVALVATAHPLAELPLDLQSCERRVFLGSFAPGISSWSMPFGPTERPARSVRLFASELAATEITTAAWSLRAASAFESWTNGSNGRLEFRAFQVERTSDCDETMLGCLGLECLSAGDTVSVRVGSTSSDAFACLHSAAANGGAYTHGYGNAYGRLAAWRSMGALMGCPEDAELHAMAKLAEESSWILFDSPNLWFDQVAWDVGIVCLRPEINQVTILAATDTD